MENQEEVLDLEPQDSTPDEELDLELEQEDAAPEATDDAEALKQRIAVLEAKNKQLYARVKKGAPEKPKSKSNTTEPEVDDDIRRDVAELKTERTKRLFGYEHGLSPDEVDAVFRINSNPSAETLKDPFVKGGLQALRAKRSVENATANPSKRASVVDGKTFTTMTKEERAKNWSDLVKKETGRK